MRPHVRAAAAAAMQPAGSAANTPSPSASAAPPSDDSDLETPTPGFAPISKALAEVAAGRFVVVMDDEDRENEGDLIMAADRMTPQAMAFMVRHTSGVVCVSLGGAAADRLVLPLMVPAGENKESMSTAFTVTVDLLRGEGGRRCRGGGREGTARPFPASLTDISPCIRLPFSPGAGHRDGGAFAGGLALAGGGLV